MKERDRVLSMVGLCHTVPLSGEDMKSIRDVVSSSEKTTIFVEKERTKDMILTLNRLGEMSLEKAYEATSHDVPYYFVAHRLSILGFLSQLERDYSNLRIEPVDKPLPRMGDVKQNPHSDAGGKAFPRRSLTIL